ncbi:CDP-diacylglycerol--glycerol-3-phosphate 3-phosphatidyltransferase [Spiroplasma endosymbiont of Labia minor]|uniref:CDP-diacylglycerol--glycerol-3-phosphate 3-phosphatidyltransferase n=1 Tax=Spiroplasma endosymbiont of Labia minor TaxID=3066305 RepID=UPI003BAF70AC
MFRIVAFTDFLDDWIARKYNQTTTFGKFADAAADKILNNSVIIIFAVMQILPIWMVLIGFIRDFTIDALRQILSSKNILMGAGPLGKWRTAIQMIGLFILFFINFHTFGGSWNETWIYDEYGWINQLALIPMYLATLFAIISMCDYINKNKKVILDSLKSDDPVSTNKENNT